MLAVCLGLRPFLWDLTGHHVLLHSDSLMAVSNINYQGGLSSRRLFILAEHLLRWAQINLRSLRATHVPGKMNLGADMLSRSNVPSDEWTLHPQTERSRLLTAAPWPIPLRRDLLSKLNGWIWHRPPELWALHLWPLDGSLQTLQRVCEVLFLRLEHHLRDASMPLSGLSSPPGVLPVAPTQFYVRYRWYFPSCKSCCKMIPCSRSM